MQVPLDFEGLIMNIEVAGEHVIPLLRYAPLEIFHVHWAMDTAYQRGPL